MPFASTSAWWGPLPAPEREGRQSGPLDQSDPLEEAARLFDTRYIERERARRKAENEEMLRKLRSLVDHRPKKVK